MSGRRGFTLLELLVVMGIIGVLMGLLLPAVQRVREAANQSRCRNNLRQIGLAMQMFQHAKGHLPPGYLFDPEVPPLPDTVINVYPGWGWSAYLLPHLEQSNLAEMIDWSLAVEDKNLDELRLTPVPSFICGSDTGAGTMTVYSQTNIPICEAATTSYAACYGYGGPIGEFPTLGNGLFFRNSRIRNSQITDGLSTTVAVGERAGLFCQAPWAGAANNGTIRNNPNSPGFIFFIEEAPVMVMARFSNYPLNHVYATPYDFYSSHPVAAPFLFADGSVRNLRYTLSIPVLESLATRAGGESLTEND